MGIPSVIEAALLPRLIGMGRARDLVLTGRLITAEEAHAWGLVEALGSPAEVDDMLESRIEAICNAAPGAVRAQKALCRRWETLALDAAVAAGVEAFARAYASDEPRRYMQRFMNRRRDQRGPTGESR